MLFLVCILKSLHSNNRSHPGRIYMAILQYAFINESSNCNGKILIFALGVISMISSIMIPQPKPKHWNIFTYSTPEAFNVSLKVSYMRIFISTLVTFINHQRFLNYSKVWCLKWMEATARWWVPNFGTQNFRLGRDI